MNVLRYLLVVVMATLPGVALAASQQTEVFEEVADFFSPFSEPPKVTIGEVEDVMLVPWTVTLPARIDTGATLSSLDARNVIVRNKIAEFTLGKEYGGVQLQLPIVGWSQISTSVGSERRPVVQIGICLGPKLIRTLATLKDRSHMTYPFLIGRNVLNGSFVVDTSRSKVVRPACSSGSVTQIQ